MGKLPIIIRRGIRDSDREKAAASALECGATGTACASAPATSSAATGSAATARTLHATIRPRNYAALAAGSNVIVDGYARIDKTGGADKTLASLVDATPRNVTGDRTDRTVRATDATNNAPVEEPAINLPIRSASGNDSVSLVETVVAGAAAAAAVAAAASSRVILVDGAKVAHTRADVYGTFRCDERFAPSDFPDRVSRGQTENVQRRRVRSLPPDPCKGTRDSLDKPPRETLRSRILDLDQDLRLADLRTIVANTNSISTRSASIDDLRTRHSDVCRIPEDRIPENKSSEFAGTTDLVYRERTNESSENVTAVDGISEGRVATGGPAIGGIVDTNPTNPPIDRSTCSRSRRRVVTLLLGLLAMNALCGVARGVPTGSQDTVQGWPVRSANFIDGYEDAEENDVATRSFVGPGASYLSEDELETIRRSLVQGLGLQRIPDPSKANVSQAEYERAHREYLRKVELSHEGQELQVRKNLHIFHATELGENGTRGEAGVYASEHHRHSLYFPVEIPDGDAWVDHASLRLLLDGDPTRQGPVDVHLYARTSSGPRRLFARSTIDPWHGRHARWIEFDATEAASRWHENAHENLGVEIEFRRRDVPVTRSILRPALNVFTSADATSARPSPPPRRRRRRRAVPEHLLSRHRVRRTECREDNKKCCRHEMTVIFKDLKGFDFIVQPKTFDAGYCKGRCPPRYNPAHHHALLQSLIWKEDRRKAPRPCCAPSKLTELEILYFDENDASKLKVSNWKNMRVVECACS